MSTKTIYRGQLSDTGPLPPVLVRAHFIFDAATRIPKVAVQVELQSRPEGKLLWQHDRISVTNVSAPLDLNVTALMAGNHTPIWAPGNYALLVSCFNITSPGAARKPMATDLHNLTVRAPSTPTPPVTMRPALPLPSSKIGAVMVESNHEVGRAHPAVGADGVNFTSRVEEMVAFHILFV